MPRVDTRLTRRSFAGAAALTIVPRYVLGGPGFVPPSDKINLATIGLGRQGAIVTLTELMTRPDVQVVALCDVNKGSKDYVEYTKNQNLAVARRTLGPGFETWGADLMSPGDIQLTQQSRSSLGFGGLDPVKRVVDAYYGRDKSKPYQGCNGYTDYRELLAKERGVDAVYVATPDHWHVPISVAAMKAGKNVLCQKPMAHSIGEARRMAQVARETKKATGLPVNNPNSPNTKRIAAWIAEGAIGKVSEVHNWSNRPSWAQGIDRPKEETAAPANLNWDMWVGPAPMRPYSNVYLPFVWRGWHDFGCGSFGDMGCYSFAGIFEILKLTAPVSVEGATSESFEETFPKASIVHLDFPAANGHGPIHIAWYDGGLHPARPKGLSAADDALFGHRREGVMYVGDKGIIVAGFNGDNPHVYSENPKYNTPQPGPRAARGPARTQDGTARAAATEGEDAISQFATSCKGGKPSMTNFEIQAPVTEAFLLGCMVQRFPGRKLQWDSASMKIANDEKLNAYVNPPYRKEYAV